MSTLKSGLVGFEAKPANRPQKASVTTPQRRATSPIDNVAADLDLSVEHYVNLNVESAISNEVIRKRGYRTVTDPKELRTRDDRKGFANYRQGATRLRDLASRRLQSGAT
jgi:hypothetical protein